VLANLVEGPDLDQVRPVLCRECFSLLPQERERRAEFYCLWCRRPLADDGRTPRRDAAPLPTQSDECVIFRECVDCRRSREASGADHRLQPRQR
jgi:hypothetical protein